MSHGPDRSPLDIGNRPTLYLAGPEVFLPRPEALAIGAKKKALCAHYGFEGLFPLDNDIADDHEDASRAIFVANAAMIRRADGAVLNLTPFRSPSADAGTIFELGMLFGLGTPVFAYTNEAEDFIDRVKRDPGLVSEGPAWVDSFGMVAEDFGNVDNLMIDASIQAQGRAIHRRRTDRAARFTDLGGFEACLVEARATLIAI